MNADRTASDGLTLTWPPVPADECPRDPHRAPQGPNEDTAQCSVCWSLTYAMRPENETFGHHLPDCSLERRHEGYCKSGGNGHPPAEIIRG